MGHGEGDAFVRGFFIESYGFVDIFFHSDSCFIAEAQMGGCHEGSVVRCPFEAFEGFHVMVFEGGGMGESDAKP